MTGPEVIEGRVRRAASQIRAARAVMDAGLHHHAAHHLYFVVFHLALALLATVGVAPETHRDAQQMFSLHFVKPGALPADGGLRFAQLMTLRGLSDYGVAEDLSPEAVGEARRSVLVLIPPILALLGERAPGAGAALAEVRAAVDVLAA